MAEGASRQSATVLERLDAHLPARLLGFGLIYAWGICLWDIPLPASAHANALQTDPAWFLSALLTPLACLVIALIGRQRELSSLPGVTVAAPLLCSIGSIALIGCGYTSGWVHGLCTLVAGVGTGLGPAFLVILWGCLFARISTSIVETMIPASFVATLLGALVVPELPPLPAGLIVTLLPIASGLLLALSRRSLDMGAIPPEDSADIKPLTVGPFTVLRMVVAVFVLYTLGCAAPAMSSVSLSATIDAYATVIGMLFAVALSVCIVLFSHRVNVAALYRWITVPFVVGLVIIPLSSETAAFIARVLLNTVFTGIEIISMLYFIRLSQRTALSTSFYVGLGAGAAYGGVFVGYGMMGPFRSWLQIPRAPPSDALLCSDCSRSPRCSYRGMTPPWREAPHRTRKPARRRRARGRPLPRPTPPRSTRSSSTAAPWRNPSGFPRARPRSSCFWPKVAAAPTFATRCTCRRTRWPRTSGTFTRSWAFTPSKNSSTW